MNKPDSMDDLFDLYASKEISFEELRSHAGNMDSEELNHQLELHLSAAKAIRKYAIMQQVANIHKTYAIEQNNMQVNEPAAPAPVISLGRSGFVKWSMRIAASITLLFGLYFAQYFVFYTPEKMYNNAFRAYNINTERSNATNSESEIVKAFRNGDHQQVIKLYREGTDAGNKQRFLAGYSQMQVNNYSAAEALFNEIMIANQQEGTRYFQDEAEYYLAMTELKLGKTDSALILMKKIEENKEHTFHESVTGWMIFRLKWF